MIYREELEKKYKKIRFNNKENLDNFLKIRFLTTLLIFIVILFLPFGWFYAPIIAFLYYNLIRIIFIDIPYNLRKDKLELEAINFFKILKLVFENSNNLPRSLELVSYSVKSEIALEFKLSLTELKLGKDFREAMNSLQNRLPSSLLNGIIDELVVLFETDSRDKVIDEFVVSLENNQENIKKKRMKRLPNIISIVALLFVLPILLLIIFGINII